MCHFYSRFRWRNTELNCRYDVQIKRNNVQHNKRDPEALQSTCCLLFDCVLASISIQPSRFSVLRTDMTKKQASVALAVLAKSHVALFSSFSFRRFLFHNQLRINSSCRRPSSFLASQFLSKFSSVNQRQDELPPPPPPAPPPLLSGCQQM